MTQKEVVAEVSNGSEWGIGGLQERTQTFLHRDRLYLVLKVNYFKLAFLALRECNFYNYAAAGAAFDPALAAQKESPFVY